MTMTGGKIWGGAVFAAVCVAGLVLAALDTGRVSAQEHEQVTRDDVLSNPDFGRPGDVILGEAEAPVTVMEFASLTCPHCANFKLNTFPQVKSAFIDKGLVRYTLREFSTPPVVLADAAFMLARCVDEDRYYAAVDVFFKKQSDWTRVSSLQEGRDALKKIARQIGMGEAQFEACLADEVQLKRLRAVQEQGSDVFKVQATPTLFINGEKYSGRVTDFDELSEAIMAALKKAGVSEEDLAAPAE